MNHDLSRSRLARLAPLAAAAVLFSSCGSTTSSGADAGATVASDVTSPTSPTTDAPAPTTTDAPAPPSTVPETTPPPTTPPTTETDPEPEPEPPSETPDPDCAVDTPIPPRPDSMPTMQFDTDGDGASDDEVTAYGGETWMVRIVENGVASEVALPDIDGWAYISGDLDVDGRDRVEVTDNETGTIYTIGSVGGCAELLDTRAADVDDLVARPTPCGSFGPVPAGAIVETDLALDIAGDGSADDHAISYLDGGDWVLRTVVGGTVSELDIPDVGVHAVRPLGLADVGSISAGDELIVTVGGGASSSDIGFFGFSDDGCVYPFLREGTTEPFLGTVGATIGTGSGVACGTGYVALWGHQLEDDDTWSAWGAAYEEKSLGEIGYIGASDDYSEGLAQEDLRSPELDCFGLSL